MRQHILTTIILVLLSFTNLSYAKSDKEIQRDLYESLNQKNQEREVPPLSPNTSNWPGTELSSAVSAAFTQFDDKFNIYLWRDAKDNVWVKIEPTDGEIFICGAAFDIFQNGTFRLQDDGHSIVKFERPDGSSICGDVSATAIYKLTTWSFVADSADIKKPFVLFHNEDMSEERESFLSLNTSNIFDSSLNQSNTLFDFAEITYPQFFSPSKMGTSKIQGYWARYYSDTDTYLGTLGDDVYVYGEVFGGLLYVGKVSDFIQESNDSGNTFIINTDDKKNINPFTLITDTGSINVPYIVRDSNGSPTSGYGVWYITNNGEEWKSIFNPLTGELQSINYTDAQGAIKISFTNYTADFKQVDLLVDYGKGKTDSIQGLSTLSLGLFLDSMTSYRKDGSTVDTGNLAKELNDFEGWVKAYLHEHIEKVINWAEIIGLSFEGLNHRFDTFLNKAQEDSSRITKDIAHNITCVSEECVLDEVKENVYVNGNSSESGNNTNTDEFKDFLAPPNLSERTNDDCKGVYPEDGDYSYRCFATNRDTIFVFRDDKNTNKAKDSKEYRKNGKLIKYRSYECARSVFNCTKSLTFNESCDGSCEFFIYGWNEGDIDWYYNNSKLENDNYPIRIIKKNKVYVDGTDEICSFAYHICSIEWVEIETINLPLNDPLWRGKYYWYQNERRLTQGIVSLTRSDATEGLGCIDKQAFLVQGVWEKDPGFDECVIDVKNKITNSNLMNNYPGYSIPNW